MPLRKDRLQKAREDRELTQRQLAQICGITEFQISRYETGKSSPNASSLELLAQSLEVSLDYLFGLSQSPRGQIGDSELNEEEQGLLATFRKDSWQGVARLSVEKVTNK